MKSNFQLSLTNDANDVEKSKQFREELTRYNSQFGRDSYKNPQMGGKELDLYKLFREVVGRGGYNTVLENKLWKDIVNALDISSSCTSASFLLRNHYNRYLLSYEQHYLKSHASLLENNKIKTVKEVQNNNLTNNTTSNPQLDQKLLGKKIIKPDMDYSLFFRHTKNSFQNYKDKSVFKKVRLTNSIPDLKRVVLAFESHNTSEIIWSLNILLLFSSNTNVNLVMDNQPYLIESLTNYLLYCVSNVTELSNIFRISSNDKDKEKEKLVKPIVESQGKNNNTNLIQPQYNFTNDININKTTSLSYLSKKEKNLDLKQKTYEKAGVSSFREEILENELLEHLLSILQIIRNLSMIRANEPSIVKNSKLMNLIYLLLINSNLTEIKINVLDILTNLAKHVILKDIKYGTSILSQIFELVKSPYKETSEQAIECLRRLTFPNGNDEFFIKLNDDFYEELVNMLIAYKQDIRESALEIMYCISDTMIAKSKLGKQSYCVERLISLLCSNSADNKIAKFSACILSNLATIPYNSKLIMAYEEELFMAACLDETLTKILMGIVSN